MRRNDRILITGVDTELGAAVRRYFWSRGATTFGLRATPQNPGGAEMTRTADLADAAAVRAAVITAGEAMGGIDVLVTAHGLPIVGAVTEQPMEEFWSHVDAVLTGSFLVAQAVAELMRAAASGGRIVLTTSRWHIGGPDLAAVATAAGGIVALTKTLTRDFGRFGVGVNAVAVGAVESEWSVCDAAGDVHAATSPAGRPGTVDEVARVIGLLGQRRLGAAVGQIVNVDGGLSRNRV